MPALIISLSAALLVGCSDYSYNAEQRTDIFQQSRLNSVDVLFVVDNSCSMAEEQAHLAENFQGLVDDFEAAEVDWRLAVTTTEVSDTDLRGKIVGGTWVDAETRDAADAFGDLIAVGTESLGLEMGLEAARLATSEPHLSEDNASFLRDDASLAFVFVSDEDDISPWSVDAYLEALMGLKGDGAFRDEQAVRFVAIVGDSPPAAPGGPSCAGGDGEAAYGERYVAVAERTGGLARSICDDFDGVLDEVGLTISGLVSEFELSALPKPETIAISLYSGMSDAQFERELAEGVDFTLDLREDSEGAQSVHVVFTEDQRPPSEWVIAVDYELLAAGGDIASYFGGAQ